MNRVTYIYIYTYICVGDDRYSIKLVKCAKASINNSIIK